MKVRLKVLTGGSQGKELKLKEGEFLIGRSDSCHLRPKSDAISRKHCVLFVDPKHVRVRDLKSRNGTLVNGEKIDAEVELKMGDRLTVGPLEFELLISQEQAAPQKAAPREAAAQAAASAKSPSPAAKSSPQPAAASQQPATAKAKAKAGGGGNVGDEDIFSWLDEADEVDREERKSDLTVRQFKMDPSNTNAEADGKDSDTIDISAADKSGDTVAGKTTKGKKEKKKEPGKLPTVPSKTTENSQEAASDALRQFFKRQ